MCDWVICWDSSLMHDYLSGLMIGHIQSKAHDEGFVITIHFEKLQTTVSWIPPPNRWKSPKSLLSTQESTQKMADSTQVAANKVTKHTITSTNDQTKALPPPSHSLCMIDQPLTAVPVCSPIVLADWVACDWSDVFVNFFDRKYRLAWKGLCQEHHPVWDPWHRFKNRSHVFVQTNASDDA